MVLQLQRSLLLLVLMAHSLRDVESARSFDFPSFNLTEKLLIQGDAQHMVNKSSIWLQPTYMGNKNGKNYSCGAVIYAEAIQMRNSVSREAVASFSTSFTFSMSGRNSAGMAFMITARSPIWRSPGASLCLVPKARNGNPDNHVFAVEFDTWKNPEFDDPSDNHVGVNVNSMNSIEPVYNLIEGLVTNQDFTSWIDYNSTTQALAVYLSNGSPLTGISKPADPIIQLSSLDLAPVFHDDMYVGFTGSGAMFPEVKKIMSWSFQSFGVGESPITPPVASAPESSSSLKRKRTVGVGIIAGAIAAGCASLVALFCVFYFVRRRRRCVTKALDFTQMMHT